MFGPVDRSPPKSIRHEYGWGWSRRSLESTVAVSDFFTHSRDCHQTNHVLSLVASVGGDAGNGWDTYLVRKVHVRNEVQIRFGKVHPTQLPYSVLMVSSIVMPTQRGGSMLRRRLRGDTHRNIKAMARKPASLSHPALLQPLHDRLKRCFLGPWRLLSNTELGSVVAPRKVIKLTGLCKERSMAALSDVFEPLGKKKENEKVTEE